MATTSKRAAKLRSMTGASRPSTGGNKNVVRGKKPQSDGPGQKAAVAGVFSRTHRGPYLGRRSL
jgi:hypothetical protein